MAVFNQSLFDIPFNWDRVRFEASRRKCRLARKRIEMSITGKEMNSRKYCICLNLVQFEKQIRSVFSKNVNIEQNTLDINERLSKCYDKLRILDNMVDLASQSLTIYFEKVVLLLSSVCYARRSLAREWNMFVPSFTNIA